MLILKILAAGIVGTSLMSLSMTIIHRKGWANADMIRALGSLITRNYEDSLGPGLAIHFISGCLFAIPYALILGTLSGISYGATVGASIALGLFHGASMSFVLLAVVAGNHPVERFREAGFDVASAHIVGHVLYGLGVGLIIGL